MTRRILGPAILRFLAWLIGVIAIGIVLGALSFAVLGPLFTLAYSTTELARLGAQKIGFLAMIWAPGVALVMTVKHAYEQRRSPDRGPTTPPPDDQI